MGSEGHYASAHQILLTSVQLFLRYSDFLIFKMAAAAIFDYGNHKILLTDRVQRAEIHYCATFCQNRSVCCGDKVIFTIFSRASRTLRGAT